MKFFFYTSLFIPFLLLSGCANHRHYARHTPEHQAKILAQTTHFKVSGRIGFKNKQQGNSAAFHWQQNQNQFTVQIQAPLGAYTMNITGHPNYVWIEDSKGAQFKTTDPKTALQERLGWFLPIAHLKYWLSGRAVPNLPIQQMKQDEQQTLLYLSQANWSIHYLDHQNFQGFWLPKKMILKQGSVQIKFFFKRWSLH